MICKKLMAKTFLFGPISGAILFAVMVVGCTGDTGLGEDPGSDRTTATQGVSEREGGDSGGAHGGRREGSGDSGEHGSGGESGSERTGGGGESGSGANTLAPDETFDAVRGGARLILNYDAPSNSFKGTVENTTSSVLSQVRIEVHLSNGTELGPTTPVDLAPGQTLPVTLASTQASFTGWVAHAEVGGGGKGSESGGEGVGASNEAAMEAAMSSPITPLGQTWNGVLGGLAVSARYDAGNAEPSTRRCRTRPHRRYATCRPSLT